MNVSNLHHRIYRFLPIVNESIIPFHVGFFCVILALRPDWFGSLLREDSVFENLGGLMFLITSILLFRRFRRVSGERFKWQVPALLALMGSALFLFAAGEEISWGQRIFGVKTPPWLSAINDQNEINLHNVQKSLFDQVFHYGCVMASLLFLLLSVRDREHWFGFKLPAMSVVFALMSLSLISHPDHIAMPYVVSILGFGVATLLVMVKRRRSELRQLFILLSSIVFCSWVFGAKLEYVGINHGEIREYLFAVITLLYSISISYDGLPAAILIEPSFASPTVEPSHPIPELALSRWVRRCLSRRTSNG